MMKKLKIAQIGYIVISFAFYFTAVVCLLYRHLPPDAICVFCGVTLLAYGVVKIIGYFSEDLFCLAFRYDLAFGILALVLGVIVLVRHTQLAIWLSPGIGWFALLDSVLKVQMSEEAKKFGLEQWSVIFIIAIVTGILSVMLIFKGTAQASSTYILTALILFAEGVMNDCVIKFATMEPSHWNTQSEKENQREK